MKTNHKSKSKSKPVITEIDLDSLKQGVTPCFLDGFQLRRTGNDLFFEANISRVTNYGNGMVIEKGTIPISCRKIGMIMQP